MIRISRFLLILVMACSSCTDEDTSEQEAAIRLLAMEFNAAVVQHRLPYAINLIDSATIDSYSDLLAAARSATADDLQTRSLTEKLIIMNLRHLHPLEELQAMSAEDVFAEAFDSVCAAGYTYPYLGRIVVNGDQAYATARQRSSKPVLFFTLEQESWKISLFRSLHQFEDVLAKACDQLAIQDEQAILGMIAANHFHPPSPLILESPLDFRLPTILRDGWAPDYPGEPITLDEPERYSHPSPQPRMLFSGQKVEVLFRVLPDNETNQYLARREALWVSITTARSGVFIGALMKASSYRSELQPGCEVLFYPASVLTIQEVSTSAV